MEKYKNKRSGKFRSNLEKFCAKELTNAKIKFNYEQWKIELVPKFVSPIISYEKVRGKFAPLSNNIRAITYTPDFVGDNWIIETKGLETADFKIKWKLFKKYLVENNTPYTMVFKPTNQKQVLESIKIIKNYGEEQCKNQDKRTVKTSD